MTHIVDFPANSGQTREDMRWAMCRAMLVSDSKATYQKKTVSSSLGIEESEPQKKLPKIFNSRNSCQFLGTSQQRIQFTKYQILRIPISSLETTYTYFRIHIKALQMANTTRYDAICHL